MTPLERAIVAARLELAVRERDWRRIFLGPHEDAIPFLMSFMVPVDSRTGEVFSFEHLREPLERGEVWLDTDGVTLRCAGWDGHANVRGGHKTWRWQRWIVDRIVSTRRRIDLKGRQIGDTWINVGYDVAEALLKPGADSLIYRQKEKDAIKNVQRWWILYTSLPPWILERVPSGKRIGPVRVIRPDRGDRPGRDGVSVKFADGRVSDVVPMTSAESSGHGESTRKILLDEAAHIDLLADIRAAVEPAAGELGDIGIVSTAHGRSNPDTGEGNEFHRVWMDALDGSQAYDAVFLPFNLHPDRDEWWYDNAPEVQSLPLHKRNEQFPRKWQEAFMLSDRIFFDEEALAYYTDHTEKPEYAFELVADFRQCKVVKRRNGKCKQFRAPRSDRQYAIMGDPASGHGRDKSAAYVIDLTTGEWCVEYHAKVSEDVFADDLYWLGKRYNTALIGVETQGGNGTATVIALRDGANGRPPYPKLYRHRNETRRDHPDSSTFGMPMDPKNRNLIVNQIETWVRERSIPFVTDDLHYQMTEFVFHDHGPSPAARDGSHDDCVFAAAGAIDLFRRYGRTLGRAHKKPRREREEHEQRAVREGQPPGFKEDRYRRSDERTAAVRKVVDPQPH
jgi:hypothetical protein